MYNIKLFLKTMVHEKKVFIKQNINKQFIKYYVLYFNFVNICKCLYF